MKFVTVSLLPELIEANFRQGVVATAWQKNLIQIQNFQPREQVQDVHKTVDDRPFGGGDGMIMMAEPLAATIELAKAAAPKAKVLAMSAHGRPWTNAQAQELSDQSEVILVCGRYGGFDQRLLNEYVDQEVSIGDYVLSGGELAAAVIIDSTSRWVPGVLGHSESANSDSFNNAWLEEPAFTRPREWRGQEVPEILLSGNHAKIAEWKRTLRYLNTWYKRPDLFKSHHLNAKELQNLKKFWESLSPADRKSLGLSSMSWEGFGG